MPCISGNNHHYFKGQELENYAHSEKVTYKLMVLLAILFNNSFLGIGLSNPSNFKPISSAKVIASGLSGTISTTALGIKDAAASITKVKKAILDSGVKQVIFSAMALGWKELALDLKKENPDIKIKVFYLFFLIAHHILP